MARTPLCERCKLPHPPLTDCFDALAATVKGFLLRTARIDKCACGAQIFWVQHLSGATAPYTENALTHFASCPNADQHRRS